MLCEQVVSKTTNLRLANLKGGLQCLFHAFRVVYTVKELDSHAKHEKLFGCITEYCCAKNLTSGFVQVSERFFSIVALADVNDWWNSVICALLPEERARACIDQSESKCFIHQCASSSSTAQDLLGKNVSKEVCFWLWGKDNPVQLPEEQAYMNSGCSLFFRDSKGVSQVCLLTNVLLTRHHLTAEFAHRLILKDGSFDPSRQ